MRSVFKSLKWFGLLWLIVFQLNQLAFADTFWIKDQQQPVYGQLMERLDDKVIVNQTTDGKQFEKAIFSRDKVVAIIVNYDVKRLESLDPNKLEDYRDFAEELSSQADDPVARQLAIRLYLIAAANSGDSSQSVRASSLAGLVRLAATEIETVRWQTLQFLSDQTSDVPLQNANPTGRPSEAVQAQMLDLVQSLRKGNGLPQAIDDAMLEPWSAICRKSELEEISRANRPSTAQLRKLLQIEFQIRNPNPDQTSTQNDNWGSLALMPSQPFAFIPNFENATDFDPFKAVFKNGEWIKPAGN